jgi:hypothetical protein
LYRVEPDRCFAGRAADPYYMGISVFRFWNPVPSAPCLFAGRNDRTERTPAAKRQKKESQPTPTPQTDRPPGGCPRDYSGSCKESAGQEKCRYSIETASSRRLPGPVSLFPPPSSPTRRLFAVSSSRTTHAQHHSRHNLSSDALHFTPTLPRHPKLHQPHFRAKTRDVPELRTAAEHL